MPNGWGYPVWGGSGWGGDTIIDLVGVYGLLDTSGLLPQVDAFPTGSYCVVGVGQTGTTHLPRLNGVKVTTKAGRLIPELFVFPLGDSVRVEGNDPLFDVMPILGGVQAFGVVGGIHNVGVAVDLDSVVGVLAAGQIGRYTDYDITDSISVKVGLDYVSNVAVRKTVKTPPLKVYAGQPYRFEWTVVRAEHSYGWRLVRNR